MPVTAPSPAEAGSAPAPVSDHAPRATADRRDGRAAGSLWTLSGGAALALAVAWAAARSGAADAATGRVLGRLDLGGGVLLAAGAAAGATRFASASAAPRRWSEVVRRRLRDTMAPWWVVVSIGLFLFPTVAGDLVPSDEGAPTWPVVVREWAGLGSLAPPPDGVAPWPPGSAGRLGTGWLVTAALAGSLVVAMLGLLRRPATAERPRLVAIAGAVAIGVGLVGRVLVEVVEPTGWGVVARVAPTAHLHLAGAGMIGAVLGRGIRVRRDATVPTRIAAGLALGGAVLLVAGAAGFSTASTLGPGGMLRTAVAHVLLVVTAAAAVATAVACPPRPNLLVVDRASRLAAWPMVMVVPLAAQLWSLRAGGGPGTQRLGSLVIATVGGAAIAGWALGRARQRLFGVHLDRRIEPFTARLATITTGALAWRLLTLVSINRTNPAGGDPFFYHHQANMLADRVGYSEPFRWVELGLAVPSAIHPPLMSTWLATGSVLGARTFLAHKALSALLGVLVVPIAALVARRLAGDRAALVTAVLVAAYPNLWVIDGSLWPEGIYSSLVALAVLAAYHWWERPDLPRAGLLGVAIALAALTRGEALFLYPLLVVPLVVMRRGLGWGRRLRVVVVVGLVGALLFAPWTVRNLSAFDTFVPLSTNGDEVLYYANCPDSYHGPLLGYWSFNCQVREREVTGEPPGNEAEKARYWRSLGVRYARDNAGRIPTVVAARILREVDVFRPGQNIVLLRVEGRPTGASRVGQWAWWVMAPVGVAGLVLLRRRHVLVWPLVSLGLMVLVTTVYAYGAIRFRTPLEVSLLIGAGIAVDHLWRRRQHRPVPDDGFAPQRSVGERS